MLRGSKICSHTEKLQVLMNDSQDKKKHLNLKPPPPKNEGFTNPIMSIWYPYDSLTSYTN